MPSGRPAKRRRAPTTKGEREQTASRRYDKQYKTTTRRAVGVAAASKVTDNVPDYDVGKMDQRCQHCGAVNFRGELENGHFNICCSNGKVVQPESCVVRQPPDLLMCLLSENTTEARNFRENIIRYNSAMVFASLNVNIDPTVRAGGPFTYRIHGNVYTMASNLADTDRPAYGQLFVIDPQTALDQRMQRKENEPCHTVIMEALDTMIRSVNPFAAAFKNLITIEKQQGPSADLCLMFKKEHGKDKRRYNLPTANEVSVIFTGPDGAAPDRIDFSVHRMDGHVFSISHTSPNSDPMAFPLLFPYGEQGWHENMEHNPCRRAEKRIRLTLRDFYRARLAVKEGFSALHHGGKLFQQFIVVAYVKIETNNLFYLKQNQAQLRVDRYKGLMDHLAKDTDDHTKDPGRVFILPSTFPNSPRNMQQNYQDAMAIVNKFGKPDVFITFTCNPKWSEITQHLQGQQKAEGRPDLVARVFHLKLKELLSDIKRGVLGNVLAQIHVIEFQKRGLPHAHILIILRPEDKIRGRELIDQLVSAEIPDPVTEPALYKQVVSHMVHGPCGSLCKKSPCMEGNVCTKQYPKNFQDETQECVDGYPCYRRRRGPTFEKNGCVLDNRWIVPYNKFLIRKFDAHINVEVCSSIRSVKYLYKYVYKGHDCASMELASADNHNEIQQFVDGRTVTPPEAAWRIFSFLMHEQSHTIVRLAVHLPLEQPVVFRVDDIAGAVQRSTETTLTAFFSLCSSDLGNLSQLCYPQVAERYRFDSKERKWHPRVYDSKHVISRMYTVSPMDRERYFLRMLLLRVPCPTSFEYLRTFNGTTFDTFFEACKARGFLADDEEWSRCLEEAALHRMPTQLRQLFAVILTFCHPQNPDASELFSRHAEALMEDFSKDCSADLAQDRCLMDIRGQLRLHNKSLSEFGLPEPRAQVFSPEIQQNAEEQLQKGMEMYELLNEDQRLIVDRILGSCGLQSFPNADGADRLFFMDGPAGTGKTFVYNTIMRILRGHGKTVFPVAPTGIAATLLDGGRTVHSRFKLPVPMNETSTSSIKPGDFAAAELNACDLIIWDEAPMSSGLALAVVDRMLRDIAPSAMKNAPFGGKVILMGGDFRQCLPVVARGARAAITNASLVCSRLWPKFTRLSLTRNMRADPAGLEFANWLLALGEGKLQSCEKFGEYSFQIPQDCISDQTLEEEIFGDMLHPDDCMTYAQSAILTPCNETSLDINRRVIDKIEGEGKVYHSIDSVACDTEEEARNYPLEFINNQTPSGMPPYELFLKVGTPVMLLRNLNPAAGLCNGTRMVVTRLHDHVLETKLLSSGETAFIPRINCEPSGGDVTVPFRLRRQQFTVRPAFAMTITKAQGQTFGRIGLDLPSPAFGHGQIYVAFSRAASF